MPSRIVLYRMLSRRNVDSVSSEACELQASIINPHQQQQQQTQSFTDISQFNSMNCCNKCCDSYAHNWHLHSITLLTDWLPDLQSTLDNSALSTTFPRSIPATFYQTAHSLKHRHKLTALNYWISRTFNDISHQIPKLSRPYSVFKDFPGPGKMDAFSFDFQRSVATQTITKHTESRVSIFSCGLRVSSRSRLFPPSVPATWDPAHNGIHLLLCLAATENT